MSPQHERPEHEPTQSTSRPDLFDLDTLPPLESAERPYLRVVITSSQFVVESLRKTLTKDALERTHLEGLSATTKVAWPRNNNNTVVLYFPRWDHVALAVHVLADFSKDQKLGVDFKWGDSFPGNFWVAVGAFSYPSRWSKIGVIKDVLEFNGVVALDCQIRNRPSELLLRFRTPADACVVLAFGLFFGCGERYMPGQCL